MLQSEQYHPVAQTHLLKGLECKIEVITSVRPQSTVSYTTSSAHTLEPGNEATIQLAWVYIPGSLFLLVLVHKSLGTRLGYQEASKMPMSSWY